MSNSVLSPRFHPIAIPFFYLTDIRPGDIFLILNDEVWPLQQEGFLLPYDLTQAVNLLGDAAPCLVIIEADIWE